MFNTDLGTISLNYQVFYMGKPIKHPQRLLCQAFLVFTPFELRKLFIASMV